MVMRWGEEGMVYNTMIWAHNPFQPCTPNVRQDGERGVELGISHPSDWLG